MNTSCAVWQTLKLCEPRLVHSDDRKHFADCALFDSLQSCFLRHMFAAYLPLKLPRQLQSPTIVSSKKSKSSLQTKGIGDSQCHDFQLVCEKRRSETNDLLS